MSIRTILLVSGDFSESNILDQLSNQSFSRGFTIRKHLAYGKDIAPLTIDKVAGGVDLVLSSISGNFRDEVQAGLWAQELGIPFGLYAGGYGSHEMAAFIPLRASANLIFHAHKREIKEAQRLFPNATVMVVGNPMWENFASPPFSSKVVRERLDIKPTEKLIFVPGDPTSLATNFFIFASVIEATHKNRMKGWQSHVVIGQHPGDRRPIEIYHEVKESSSTPVQFITKETMPGPHILPGIDLMVTAMSSLGIEAAFQRKPVINLIPPLMMRQIKATRPNFSWEPLAIGAAQAVYASDTDSLDDLAYHMDHFLQPKGFEVMRANQESFYKEVPVKGSAVRLMVDFLEKL